MDASDPAAEGRGVVAAQGPQHAPGRDVGTDVGAEGGQVDDDEEAKRAGEGVCGLAVELSEGKGPGVAEERVEIVDAVEDGDYVEKGGQEADNVLRENRFGNVDTRLGDFFRKMRDTVAVVVSTSAMMDNNNDIYLRCADSVRTV